MKWLGDSPHSRARSAIEIELGKAALQDVLRPPLLPGRKTSASARPHSRCRAIGVDHMDPKSEQDLIGKQRVRPLAFHRLHKQPGEPGGGGILFSSRPDQFANRRSPEIGRDIVEGAGRNVDLEKVERVADPGGGFLLQIDEAGRSAPIATLENLLPFQPELVVRAVPHMKVNAEGALASRNRGPLVHADVAAEARHRNFDVLARAAGKEHGRFRQAKMPRHPGP